MSGAYSVTVSEPFDANLLVGDIRQADLTEWVLAGGRPVRESLGSAIKGATGPVRTMWLGADPLCIWGANATEDPRVGLAWLIGTNLGQAHAMRVQRHFREGIRELHAVFPVLEAWAYEGNRFHHLWMERLEFERTGETRRLGLGAVFIRYRRESEQCA